MDDFDILAPAEETTEQQPSLEEKVMSELTATNKRLDDITRFQQQAQATQPTGGEQTWTPQQIAEWSQKDPVGYANWVATSSQELSRKATNEQLAMMRVDLLVEQYKQSNPELVPFEDEIRFRANQLAYEAQQKNENAPPQKFIEAAITEFKGKLQKYSGGNKDASQIKQNAMKFEVGTPGGSTEGYGFNKATLEAAKHDDALFAKVQADYFRSRGISL